MAIMLKIDWVEQSDATDFSRRVQRIGGNWDGFRWSHTGENAVQYILDKSFCYFIQNGERPTDLIVAGEPGGFKYLSTRADTETVHALLLLSAPLPKQA